MSVILVSCEGRVATFQDLEISCEGRVEAGWLEVSCEGRVTDLQVDLEVSCEGRTWSFTADFGRLFLNDAL